MLRLASFHSAMARLALVAALLLATVPTLGRLASQATQFAHSMRAEPQGPSTVDGLRVEVATRHVDAHHVVEHEAQEQHAHEHHAHAQHATAHHASGDPDAPSQVPHEHGGPDCAYCPLLLSLLAAATSLLWLRASAVRAVLLPWPGSGPRAFVHPCGLGSRGPPGANTCLRA